MAEARSQHHGKLNFESNDHHVATSPDISMVQQPSDDNSDEEQKEPPKNPAGALPQQIPDIYGIPIIKNDGTISFSAMINIIGKFLAYLFKLINHYF